MSANIEKADSSMGVNCEACKSRGFIVVAIGGKGDLAIQRCNGCEVFANDNEAIVFVTDLAVAKLNECYLTGRVGK